jgi:hypothetical protein
MRKATILLPVLFSRLLKYQLIKLTCGPAPILKLQRSCQENVTHMNMRKNSIFLHRVKFFLKNYFLFKNILIYIYILPCKNNLKIIIANSHLIQFYILLISVTHLSHVMG